MKCRGWAVMAVLLLAGCGNEAPNPAPEATPATATSAKVAEVSGTQRDILAFGDSLFAGYGLDAGESYPDKLEAALRARGINAKVRNAGVSGDTTAAGLQRIEFVLDGIEDAPDLAIVELGGNDLLRGIAPAETHENLSGILTELKERGIPILIMGMRAPPNLGEAFVEDFDAIYPELAGRYGAALVPFFLEAVYDKPALIQPDRVHPTAPGIDAIVAATADDVAKALPPQD